MKGILKGFLLLTLTAGAALAGTLSPGLQRQIASMNESESITVLLAMRDQADIAALDRELHDRLAPMAERHERVVSELMQTATRSQAALLADLDDLRFAGRVNGWTSYWILNGVVVNASIGVIRELAARPDVERVEADLVVELIEPVSVDDAGRESRDIGITPGVEAVNADRCWYELGITGEGAIVACMDTGVDGNHEALSARWRGNFAPADECWLDLLGGGTTFPNDSHGHGSHVMGTITGLAYNDSIGVAPAAQWIATNPINQGVGGAFDNDVIDALEWFADPDGDPGTTDEVPDVVQNSWGVNENFGYNDCDSRWWTAIDACEAAGVVLTWSAGNEGPGGTSLRSPADRADTPYNCFSVGSTGHSPPYSISSFSSRGPSGCGGAYATKPEVVAPGSDIYSVQAGGGYTYMSGTSMAGPHVAGVVGLMRSANPDLDVTTIKQILMDTAMDLGDPGEENTYGWGMIDAYEAVLQVMSGYGTANGTVTDAGSSLPIVAAYVENTGGSQYDYTDGVGFYEIMLPAGDYVFQYSAFGYNSTTENLTVPADGTVTRDVALTAVPDATVYGYVYDPLSDPVVGAEISAAGTPATPVYSGAGGYYEIDLPLGDTYEMVATAAGYGADSHIITLSGDTQVDFNLPELVLEDFESGFSLFPWQFGGSADWFQASDYAWEGSYSARSGDIGNNQTSSMFLELEIAVAGDISFYYKVSSEAGYDYLRFYVDGSQMGYWAGEIDWTLTTFPVSTGLHTFTWTYEKDYLVSSGQDCAWVDYIVFPTMGLPEDHDPPVITHTPLSDTADTAGPWTVIADISDLSGVASADLEYNIGGAGWMTTPMSPLLVDYSGDIPGPASVGTVIEYRIRAVDASEFANEALSETWSFQITPPVGLEYCQDFEGGFDDFTVETYDPGGSTWEIGDFSGQGNTAYIQYSYSGQEDHAALISPVFDCSDQGTVELSFWHHLRMGWSGAWTDAYVRGSIDGGANWDYLLGEWHADNEPEEITIEGTEILDITGWAAGEAQVRIMFEFHDEYDWYWHVDDVCLTGTLGSITPDPVEITITNLGGGQLMLSWDPAYGAESYNVYTAGFLGDAWVFVDNTVDTTYLLNAGANETALFMVRSVAGELLQSREVRMLDPLHNWRPTVPRGK